MSRVTFPVLTGSRIKQAEMYYKYPKGRSGAAYVFCPYCATSREVDEPGLHDCLEDSCGRTFEAVVPEPADDEGNGR